MSASTTGRRSSSWSTSPADRWRIGFATVRVPQDTAIAWLDQAAVRARRRARCRHRPSRRQARQPPARRRRRGARLRLRHRARGRARSAHVHRHHPGQLGVHGARAGTRGARHVRQRPVRARLRGLRAADRTPPVRGRVTDGRGDPPRLSAASPRIRDRAEPARGGGRSAGPRPGEEPRRPAAKLQGTCQRLAGCAAGGRGADALHSPFRKRRADGVSCRNNRRPVALVAAASGAGGRRHRGRPRVEQRGRRPAAHGRRHRDRRPGRRRCRPSRSRPRLRRLRPLRRRVRPPARQPPTTARTS